MAKSRASSRATDPVAQTPEGASLASARPFYNQSAMAPGPGLILRLFGWIFFRKVRFEQSWAERLVELNRGGPVVFVMNCQSLLDYMYLCWAFPRNGVPLVGAANGIGWLHALAIHPLYSVLGQLFGLWFGRLRRPAAPADLLRASLQSGRPIVIFLRPSRSLLQWGGGFRDELLEMVIQQQADGTHGVHLLPTMVVWKRHPGRSSRSFLDMAFGGPEAPGKLRKTFNFLLNFGSALLRVGDPLPLDQFVSDWREQGILDSQRATRQLRYEVLRSWSTEQKVIRGPVLKNAKQIRSEIARNTEVQTAIAATATETGVSVEHARKDVDRYLKEMAADFRLGYVEGFCLLLGALWDRLYDGLYVPEADLERIRTAAKQAPLIIAPNHRSHVDYLVISYVFYTAGLIPPHIAAGINLSFFPMGHIFRHSGAFFIRRSFRSNPLYQLAFRYYIRKIVKEGYWIEFFPEGGRSRTGKVLPPKVGLMRELVLAVVHRTTEDLLFCPTSIAYEKIVEEASIARELAGGEKKAENVGGILKASKALAHKHGRLYMRFAEPLSIRAYLDERIAWLGSQERLLEPAVFANELKRLAYRILRGINDAATVTPTALLAMVALAHPRRGLSRSQLLLRIGYLTDYFHFDKGAPLSDTLEAAIDPVRERIELPEHVAIFERPPHGSLAYGRDFYRARTLGHALEPVIDKMLRAFRHDGVFVEQNYGDETAYTVEPGHRMRLDYYKNNAIHLVVQEAILSTALLSARDGGPVPYQQVDARCRFLSSLLQLEFVYDPDKGFIHQFFETYGRFEHAGWITENPDGSINITEGADELLVFFSRCIQNFIEAYWVVLSALSDIGAEAVVEKDWLTEVQKRAHAMAERGEIAFPEAAVSVLLKNALERFVTLKLVDRFEPDEGGKKNRRGKAETYLRTSAEQTTSILAWIPRLDEARVVRPSTTAAAEEIPSARAQR